MSALPKTPRDHWLDIGGLRHHADVWDGGGGTTVLLLHGFLDLGRSWTFTVEHLAARRPGLDWHVVALDWRGHGRTDPVGAGGYYHFPDYVRDLEQVARAVRRERLIVVAHSMGAMVASLWLGARPEAADGLLLVEGLGPMGLEPEAHVDRMATWLDQTAPFAPAERPLRDLDHAAARLSRVHPRMAPEDVRRLAGWATVDGPTGLRWRYDPLHRTRAPLPMPDAAAAAFFRRIRCPMRWIGGADSPLVGERVERWLGLRGDVPRLLLPACGHMVQNDQPARLATELVDFVSACTRPGA